jgi:purple acid phosphatase-like protein
MPIRTRLWKYLAALILLTGIVGAQPRHLYLTWEKEDTARTQTIVFQTVERATDPRIELVVQGSKTKSIPSKTFMFRGYPRRVHWVTLTGLKPHTVYKFRAGDTRFGMSSWRTFRTLPADDTPIKFITGGDMYKREATVDLLKAGAKQEPDVALVGGDIAYANGSFRDAGLWDDWLDNWDDNLRHADGRMVGMICAIGNHEVDGSFGQPKVRAPFYFIYFPQGGESYFTRKLGSEIDLIVLDSGHVKSHASQVPFLDSQLGKSKARFQVALYHVPCYPTHRSYREPYSVAGRTHWVPVFDKHRLPLAFENHDHTFKRTFPLRAGKVSKSDGTVYLGDGCWGMDPRSVSGKRWYHAKALSRRHIWMVENRDSGLFCQALDTEGNVFDEVEIPSAK